MSYKVEVKADSTGTWAGNGLTFESSDEAMSYGKDLAFRWTAVREMRVVQSDEPVNYAWRGGRLVHLATTDNTEASGNE